MVGSGKALSRGVGPLQSPLAASLAVGLVALLSWLLGLQNGRLGDDYSIEVVRLGGRSFGQLFAFFGENYWGELHTGGLYRPLALFLLGLQKLAFGDASWAFRVVSLALHAACSIYVLRILVQLGSRHAALIGALLFAAHPIHAEAVVTVYGQCDLWSALFFLICLERALGWSSQRLSVPRSGLLALLYGASLCCKEAGVLLPLVLLAFAQWSHRTDDERRRLRRMAAVLVVPLVAFLALRMAVLGPLALPVDAASIGIDAPLWGRVQIVIVTLGSYFRLLFCPWGQTIYHGHLRDSVVGTPWVEALWLVAVPLALVLGRKLFVARRVVLTTSYVALLIAPVSNLIPIGTLVAERCLYLPSMGLVLLAAGLLDRDRRRSRIVTLALALAVVGGMLLSARVAWRWRTAFDHWSNTVADHPTSPKAHASVGVILLNDVVAGGRVRSDDPRLVTIEASLDRALELNPDSAEALKGKGRMAMLARRYRKAVQFLRRAQELRPNPDTARRLQLAEGRLAEQTRSGRR